MLDQLIQRRSLLGYKPIYLERGRKPLKSVVKALFCLIDINLYTSRGDGNPTYSKINSLTSLDDINLYTSRGDGNKTSTSSNKGENIDINLYTSRGDFFEILKTVLTALPESVRLKAR